jgi:hypothetical protein
VTCLHVRWQRLQVAQSPAEMAANVDRIIDLLELRDVADSLIGTTANGLSVGERKRFTIGVELVTNPSVLFLGASPCCVFQVGARVLTRKYRCQHVPMLRMSVCVSVCVFVCRCVQTSLRVAWTADPHVWS